MSVCEEYVLEKCLKQLIYFKKLFVNSCYTYVHMALVLI